MAINLIKGQRVQLGAALTQLKVQLGWRVNPNANPPFDLDASTFLLNSSGQIDCEENFVFYGSPNTLTMQDGTKRPVSKDHSVLGSVDDLGDDDDGSGEGNEEILVNLTKTDKSVQEILFAVSIYWDKNDTKSPSLAPRARYNFGQVRNAYIQIVNDKTNEVICRYDLDEDFSTDKGVEFGRLYKRNGEWKFQAIGEPHKDGLEPMVRKYAAKFL